MWIDKKLNMFWKVLIDIISDYKILFLINNLIIY